MFSLRQYQAGSVNSLCEGHGCFTTWQSLVLMSSLVLGMDLQYSATKFTCKQTIIIQGGLPAPTVGIEIFCYLYI